MGKDTDYITKEKKEELEKELAELAGPKRKDVLEALKYAKSLGDLSENAEYQQARENQASLEDRIKKIEHLLRTAEVVSTSGGDTVHIGSRVTVTKGHGDDREFLLVGDEESDMSEGKISNKSPFGQALFGKKKGDEVSFNTPRGEVNYKIINVS